MWSDPPASGAMVREKMGKFVAESPVDLGITEFSQPRIEHHQSLCRIGVACGAPHLRIPPDLNAAGQVWVAGGDQQLTGCFLERRAGGREGSRGWLLKKRPELREEVELLAVHRLSG